MSAESPNPATLGNPNPPRPLLPVALKSTEFWLVLLVIVALAAETFAGVLPAELAAKLMIISAGLYKLLRFILKMRAAQYQVEVALAEIDARAAQTILGPDAQGTIRAAQDTPHAAEDEVPEYRRGTVAQPGEQAGGGFRNQQGHAALVVVFAILFTGVSALSTFTFIRELQQPRRVPAFRATPPEVREIPSFEVPTHLPARPAITEPPLLAQGGTR